MGAAAKAPPSQDECEKSWQYPPEMEGWHISHNAIKIDMDTFTEAVAALEQTVAAGQPLAAWQVDAVKTFWSQFGVNVVDHHMHEEDFYFPWMQTRMGEINKMSADHKTLLVLEKQVDGLVAQVKAEKPIDLAKTLLADISSKYEEFKREMTAHLDEEETDLVPVMRQKFTQQEERKVTGAMVKHMSKFEGPATVWHLEPTERKAFMNRMGIPKPVQWLIFNPRTAQYDRLFQQNIKCVIAGTPPPPPKKGWFW